MKPLADFTFSNCCSFMRAPVECCFRRRVDAHRPTVILLLTSAGVTATLADCRTSARWRRGAMDEFVMTYAGFDPDQESLREALTSTGNGYLCTRGTAEWEDADGVHYPGTYAHSVYNRETTILGGLPVLNEDLVNLPNWLRLTLRIAARDAVRLGE